MISSPDTGEEINVAVQVNVDARAVESTDGTPTAAEARLHSLRVYAFIGDELVGCYFNDAEVADSFLMEMAVRSLSMQTVDFYVIANEAAMVKPGSSENLTEDTPRSVARFLYLYRARCGERYSRCFTGTGWEMMMACRCRRITRRPCPDAQGHTLLKAGARLPAAAPRRQTRCLLRPRRPANPPL